MCLHWASSDPFVCTEGTTRPSTRFRALRVLQSDPFLEWEWICSNRKGQKIQSADEKSDISGDGFEAKLKWIFLHQNQLLRMI
ncbi:hypothetical protein SLEP1_g20856 [Rubroshorea leprosula]|uniref:Uncharacterized protein n=1 Tax=Rubroshorea leprosula TaxID=152421 RepID=A0AAV5JEL2_9ROSI|nr:hypothetical protein SLEP1_g20856 [Rubroshorea leprosula]